MEIFPISFHVQTILCQFFNPNVAHRFSFKRCVWHFCSSRSALEVVFLSTILGACLIYPFFEHNQRGKFNVCNQSFNEPEILFQKLRSRRPPGSHSRWQCSCRAGRSRQAQSVVAVYVDEPSGTPVFTISAFGVPWLTVVPLSKNVGQIGRCSSLKSCSFVL